jgi:hypothetical protein
MRHVWGTGEVHIGFWWEDLRESDHLEDLGADGRLILKWIFNDWEGGGRDWIAVTQDGGRGWAVVNGIMKLWVP